MFIMATALSKAAFSVAYQQVSRKGNADIGAVNLETL
jgi:hypothetical protein